MAEERIPTARDIMTRKLVTLSPETLAIDAAEILLKNRISGAPVVDAQGHLLGLISEFDCLQTVASSDYAMDRHDALERVEDLMTREPGTVDPETDLFSLAHLFVTKHFRRFPVIEDGRLIGQVSRRDALRAAVAFRRDRLEAHPSYPDYPRGRAPLKH